MTTTPKQCRAGHHCDPQSFKEALDCLGHHSALSLRQMCERTGLNVNRVAKGCSLYDADHMLRVDEIVALTLNSADDPRQRNVVAIRYVCRQLSGAFVQLPTGWDAEQDAFLGAMTASTERLSEMGREIHDSLRNDGQIDAEELRRIKARTHAMHEQVAKVEALAEARAATYRDDHRDTPRRRDANDRQEHA